MKTGTNEMLWYSQHMEQFFTYCIYGELYEIQDVKEYNFNPVICVYICLCEEYLKKNFRVLVNFTWLRFNTCAFVGIMY